MRDKGRQKHTLMTANGRIRVWRKRWQPATGGSITPIDEWLDQTRETFTRGVIELACRLNRHTSGFGELAATLWRAAGLKIDKETLRELVEAEGQSLLEKARQGELRPNWQASDLFHTGGRNSGLLRLRRREGAGDHRCRKESTAGQDNRKTQNTQTSGAAFAAAVPDESRSRRIVQGVSHRAVLLAGSEAALGFGQPRRS